MMGAVSQPLIVPVHQEEHIESSESRIAPVPDAPTVPRGGTSSLADLELPVPPRPSGDHVRKQPPQDRRIDDLVSVLREFTDVMRESNANIKTLTLRLLEPSASETMVMTMAAQGVPMGDSVPL